MNLPKNEQFSGGKHIFKNQHQRECGHFIYLLHICMDAHEPIYTFVWTSEDLGCPPRNTINFLYDRVPKGSSLLWSWRSTNMIDWLAHELRDPPVSAVKMPHKCLHLALFFKF